MEKTEAIAAARALIEQSPISILITQDGEGFPSGRPMGTLAVDDDLTVWYATATTLPKCGQIGANPKVAVYWECLGEDMESYGWVQVQGRAELTQDEALRHRFWQDVFERYFPQGQDDPTYILIKIVPTTLTVLPGGTHERTVTVPLA